MLNQNISLRVLSLLTISLLGGCAIKGKSIRDVPSINSQNIQIPAHMPVPGKTLALKVLDKRSEPLQSTAVISEIGRATREALQREGITVSEKAPVTLDLTISDHETQEFKEGCVKIQSLMTIPEKARLKGEAAGCFEAKSPFGQKMQVDINKAYEESLSLIFKNLNGALEGLPVAK